MSSLSFLRSPNQAMTLTSCQARQTYIPGNSSVLMMIGVIPVWGFGKFTDGSMGFSGGIAVGQFTWQDTWPRVYSELVETWSQSDGNGQVTTTTYSQYVDIYRTVNRTTVGTGPSIDAGTNPVTKVVTDTLITITYWADAGHTISGTYTAQLQGTLFDPLSVSDGWETRSVAANNILANIDSSDVLADKISSGFGSSYVYFGYVAPVSYSPGYIIHYSINNLNYISAAGYGMPRRVNATGSIYEATHNPFASIYDVAYIAGPSPVNPYQDGYNEGSVICWKTVWKLNGLDWGYPYYPYDSNTHLNLYAHQMTLDGSGNFVFGTPYAATKVGGLTRSNPFSQSTQAFVPQDVADNNLAHGTASDFGIIGFVGTAH